MSTGDSQSRFHEIFEFKTLQRETGSTKKESYFRFFLNEQLLCKTYTMATRRFVSIPVHVKVQQKEKRRRLAASSQGNET